MEIRTKAEYFALASRGLLGNTLQQFGESVEEALTSHVHTFGVREVGAAGGGLHAIVHRSDLHSTIRRWRDAGRHYHIDEAAPDTDVVLQGELCRTCEGWGGVLGIRTGHRMRDSARLGLLRPVQGLEVLMLLDQFVDPSSRDDLRILWDSYPDAVIEFASYPYHLGRIPRRNTVIWEVRNY
jgi:hypothetical protein